MRRQTSIKHSGQVFTPSILVENMLDFCGYREGHILGKHLIDNSCGNGAFLTAATERYCNEFLRHSPDKALLKKDLERHIHGIESDPEAYGECLNNLAATAARHGIGDVHWDILCKDALTVRDYDGRMDYVVGNPPYVRVHNLETSYDLVKTFSFASGGMTDLYLIFYELGFRMLHATGKLCYITPSSWLSSVAGSGLRKHILRTRSLSGLIDLEHFQAFEGATTYTLIALFDKASASPAINYHVYDGTKQCPVAIDRLPYEDICIDGCFYIAPRHELALLKQVKQSRCRQCVSVKNGFATLADKVFIGDIPFDALTIPLIKASTGKWQRAFYPYDSKGKPLDKATVFGQPAIATYLNEHKEELLKGRNEATCTDWYLYGRTQALKDVSSDKMSINTLIKDLSIIKLHRVPAGSGVYSGLYILTRLPFERIEEAILSPDFTGYVKALKNYKNGGYYTFNSRDLEQYLNYTLSRHADTTYPISHVGYGIPHSHLQLFQGIYRKSMPLHHGTMNKTKIYRAEKTKTDLPVHTACSIFARRTERKRLWTEQTPLPFV